MVIWTLRRPEMTTAHVVIGALTLAVTFWLTWVAHRDQLDGPAPLATPSRG
jgi:cytochrome c oxidase assembly protein subunit 15